MVVAALGKKKLLPGHSTVLKVKGLLDPLDSGLRGFLFGYFFLLLLGQGTFSASSAQRGGFYVGIIERSKQYGAITISLFKEF